MVLERVVDNRASVRGTDREVVFAGVFEGPSQLTGILQHVRLARYDGALHIRGDQVHITLFFRRGVYLSARSSLQGDRLGNVLVSLGLLTDEQRDACLLEVNDEAKLGNVIVARGFLRTPQVYEGLRAQAEEIFFSTLRFNTGTYYLVAPLDMTAVPAMLRLDVQTLLLEGLRRLDEATVGIDDSAESELRRTEPIPPDELPPDGDERVFKAYNAALVSLFNAVPEADRAMLRGELNGYLGNSVAYRALFEGVRLQKSGALSGQLLINVANMHTGEPTTRMQRGLSEMLFFLMFAAGDSLDAVSEHDLQRQVAANLEAIPRHQS